MVPDVKRIKPTEAGSYNAHNRLLLSAMLAIAIVNTITIIYDIGYIQGAEAMYLLGEHFESSHGSWPYTISAVRGVITVFYFFCAWCLWSRIRHHLVLSILALLLIVLCYVWWYFDSLMFLRRLEISDYSQLNMSGFQHAGGFRGAIWWDMLILAITALLLLWQLRTLIKSK
jgi:hypothetical protein